MFQTFFLCFQGVLHSILEGLYKTAAHLLAIFHAQSLRSSLLKQLTDVVPSQKVMIELEQSLSDCENFFVSFYHVSTGILFQTGNVFGNFLNLYHCALLPAGLSFYGAVFIIDVNHEHTAVKEAQKLGIPIIGLVDTNSSPENIDHVIPGNDDSAKSITLCTQYISHFIAQGKPKSSEPKAKSTAGVRVIKKTVTKKLIKGGSKITKELFAKKEKSIAFIPIPWLQVIDATIN